MGIDVPATSVPLIHPLSPTHSPQPLTSRNPKRAKNLSLLFNLLHTEASPAPRILRLISVLNPYSEQKKAYQYRHLVLLDMGMTHSSSSQEVEDLNLIE